MDTASLGAPPLSPARTAGVAIGVLFVTAVGRMLGATAVVSLGARTGPPETDGLVVGAAILCASILGGAALVALLRRHEPAKYLATTRPTVPAVLVALAASALLVVIFDAARWASTTILVPEAWLAIYRTGPLPLLVVGFVVAAPIFEEAFFRGFLHTSLVGTRFGVAGTIALTSVLFAFAHGPEDLLSLLDPLASAILLGVLRHRTGSIWPGIAAHAFGNLQAIVTAAILA